MRNVKWCLAILTVAALGVNAAAAETIRIGIPERGNLRLRR
jgi:hypothetical protein